jgi:microcystin-dependent protein
MSEAYIGEIRMTGFNFAPVNWMLCQGQILPIQSYQALYSILGTTYGGDGVSTFALPDLRGRFPIHFGQGTGLTNRTRGTVGGESTHALAAAELPLHTHPVYASLDTTAANLAVTPAAGVLAGSGEAGYSPTANTALAAAAVSGGGSGVAHENRPPYRVVNFMICCNGLYPTTS